MIETTRDILYLVLSLAILVVSGFLSWALYYLGSVLRQSNEMITEFRVKVAELEETIADLKERMSSSAASIAFVAKEVGEVVRFVRGARAERPARRR